VWTRILALGVVLEAIHELADRLSIGANLAMPALTTRTSSFPNRSVASLKSWSISPSFLTSPLHGKDIIAQAGPGVIQSQTTAAEDHDLCPVGFELPRGRKPNSAIAAGNHGYLVRELHVFFQYDPEWGPKYFGTQPQRHHPRRFESTPLKLSATATRPSAHQVRRRSCGLSRLS
jgi:hypothetical protein